MNETIAKYLAQFTAIQAQNGDINAILAELKAKGASYAATFRVLREAGFSLDEIDPILLNSPAWTGFTRSFEDMFFDFVELEGEKVEQSASE